MPRGVSRYDEAQFQQRLWSPAVLRPNLWLDADDLSTITTVSGAVSEWRDKGINARHAAQVTAAARPTLTTFNARNAILCDGIDDFLQGSAAITSGTYTGQFNCFWVATRNTAAGGTLLTERTSTLVGVTQLGVFLGVNYISSDGLNIPSNHTISNADYAKLSTSGAVVSHLHSPASRDQFFINGSSISVLLGTASNITGGSGGYFVGRRESAAGYWPGIICEIIVMAATTTTPQRQDIEGYLAWKWGFQTSLASTHPYINRPPLI